MAQQTPLPQAPRAYPLAGKTPNQVSAPTVESLGTEETSGVEAEIDVEDEVKTLISQPEPGKDPKHMTADLLDSLGKGSRIFYYPACCMDWSPLYRFTHLCDTFVYCDYLVNERQFPNCQKLSEEIFPEHSSVVFGNITDLYQETVRELVALDPESADDFCNVDVPWGKVIDLTRHVGNLARKLRLLYFGAEGVTLYKNLFNKRSIAPRVICLKQCQDGMGGLNWTSFLRWDGPLGRAVRDNRERPEFIVSAYPHEPNSPSRPPDPNGHRYDWPWSQEWQSHSWRAEPNGYVAKLRSYVRADELPVSAGTPVSDRGRRERTVVRLLRGPYVRANVPNGEPIMSLQREAGGSLQEALRRLRNDCVERGITNAHAVGCHFEDEAPALAAWKWSGSWPQVLTIHCESDGDMDCYGPAADEIGDW